MSFKNTILSLGTAALFVGFIGTAHAELLVNYQAVTGEGGANRFWYNDGQFFISGESVAGRFQTSDSTAFIYEAARLYDITVECDNLTGPDWPNPRYRVKRDDYIISGRDVAGRCTFTIPDVEEVCADNITGPNFAPARYRRNSGDWILSGRDVGGRCVFAGPVVTDVGVFTGEPGYVAGFLTMLDQFMNAGLL